LEKDFIGYSTISKVIDIGSISEITDFRFDLVIDATFSQRVTYELSLVLENAQILHVVCNRGDIVREPSRRLTPSFTSEANALYAVIEHLGWRNTTLVNTAGSENSELMPELLNLYTPLLATNVGTAPESIHSFVGRLLKPHAYEI
jgi:hypothetical protein